MTANKRRRRTPTKPKRTLEQVLMALARAPLVWTAPEVRTDRPNYETVTIEVPVTLFDDLYLYARPALERRTIAINKGRHDNAEKKRAQASPLPH
jgi:hypothetical protein